MYFQIPILVLIFDHPSSVKPVDMRAYPIKFVLVLLFIAFGHSVNAQEVIKQENCDISSMRNAIDSLKNLYSSEGFIVLREASMNLFLSATPPQGFMKYACSIIMKNKWCIRKICGEMWMAI